MNTFLDGIVQSKLSNGEAGVKKILAQNCPKFVDQVNKILEQSNSSKFSNNYFGLLRSISQLEFVDLKWFEGQAKFIA